MPGRFWVRVAVVLGALAVLWLLLDGSGVLDFEAQGEGKAKPARPDLLEDVERELFEQMTSGPVLQGLPGVEIRRHGHGVLVGQIVLHAAEHEPRPLPDVDVELLARGSGEDAQRLRYSAASDAEGRFTIPQLPAGDRYVLLVDHAPYRRIVLRGLTVRKDKTTDVGALTLGAPTSLAGEVVDAKGRSVPGAVVQVLRDASRAESFDLRKAIFELDGVSLPLAEARVASDGRFLVADVPPGRYLVRVSAPGFATGFKRGVLVTVDEHASAVRVVLDKGAGFEGRVTDADGAGLGGGRVIAAALPGRTITRFDRVEVATGPDGSYRIDTLIPGMRYALEAWAEGHAPTVRYLEVGSGVRTLDWKLGRSGSIEGRVFDEATGEGVEGCQVTVLAGPITGISPVSTVTDAEGRYVLPHVNAGPVILFAAHAPGYQSNDEINMASVNGLRVQPGEATIVDWRLHAGGAVEGRVSTDGGRPVPYATIALVDRNAGRRRWSGELTAMSGVDGSYQVVGVRPGSYDVRVSAPGYAPPADGEETLVQMGKSLGAVEKDLTLRRGGTLEGAVTAPDGTALRGARIHLTPGDGTTNPDVLRDLTAVTAPNGTFRIPGVPPERNLLVHAEHDAWVEAAAVTTRVRPGATKSVTLRLREGATLPGWVVDARGVAVAEARVRWGAIDGVPARDLRTSFEADAWLGGRVIRTDDDGRFRIPGLAPGKHLIKVEKDGYAAWYRRDQNVAGDGVQPALTIELESTLSIRGKVSSAAGGRPIAGAFVYARERGRGEGAEADPGRVPGVLSGETDAEGRFVLERVPPGVHEVVVWFADGHIAAAQDGRNAKVRRKDVAAGASGVDFALDAVKADEGE